MGGFCVRRFFYRNAMLFIAYAVWTIADIFNGLMAFPNLIALVALNGVVIAETREFFKIKRF